MSTTAATILLVDDEESIQKLLTYPLERDGYRVVQARDGDEALRRFDGGADRPRRARRDAAEARRPRGLQAAARDEPRPDHHADRPRRRGRQGARPRARRGRLHHQAVLDPRVPEPRPGGAAAGGDAAARLRASPSRSSIDGLDDRSRAAHGRRRRRSPCSSPTSSSSCCARSRPRRAACTRRQALLEAVWGGSDYRDPRTIDVHVRHLREKLERDPSEPGDHPDRARRRLPLPRPVKVNPLRSVGARLSLALLLWSSRLAGARLPRRHPVAPEPADRQQDRAAREARAEAARERLSVRHRPRPCSSSDAAATSRTRASSSSDCSRNAPTLTLTRAARTRRGSSPSSDVAERPDRAQARPSSGSLEQRDGRAERHALRRDRLPRCRNGDDRCCSRRRSATRSAPSASRGSGS